MLAGLRANSITIIDQIQYILRGYEGFDKKLRSLGARIELNQTN